MTTTPPIGLAFGVIDSALSSNLSRLLVSVMVMRLRRMGRRVRRAFATSWGVCHWRRRAVGLMLVAMRFSVQLRAIAACAAGLLFAGNAAAECLDAPDLAAYQTAAPEDFALGATRTDRLGRAVAPVTVNGRGPFRFIVDTGANRSVLAEDLAARLGLTPNGTDNVHSVHGVSAAPVVTVERRQYGDVSLTAEALPMLSGGVLAGEQGLLGVDGMGGRRLRMDFERNCIEIVLSAQA